ncbi:MAG: DUF2256 domain-containing protein [Sphingobacteriales bacterium]|nr:MAG: DUF2256 domain-containing protein [Sphingobacteriales bacterium]
MATHKGNKSYLPQKNCTVCNQPIVWRKKWKQNWEAVKYCSQRCRNNKKTKLSNSIQL